MSKKAPPETIALTFDLFDLPTAQHRAGLAGLILQIDAMGPDGYRKSPKIVPVIEELTSTSATIRFTRDSMQGVFDELYEAKLVEVVVATKWPGETKPKTGDFFLQKKDPKTGEMKQAAGFAYDVVQPQSPCLKRHMEGRGDAWLELWRQMLWSIPRGGNNVRSRAPFIDRANDRPCGDGATAWTEIVEFDDRRAKSQWLTRPISGALMLGAQAVNAEAVPFSGRVDHNLLLHFWQLVVLTFVPQVVNKKDAKVERIGYVLAIPDVADLAEFRHAFPAILQGLEAKDAKHTPDGARLDIPDQACLEILRKLREEGRKAKSQGDGDAPHTAGDGEERADSTEADLPRRATGKKPIGRLVGHQALASDKAAEKWGRCIRAVESFHMFKLGNNVKILSFARVADRPGLIEEYARVTNSFRNPLFRAARMRAILRRRPWHWAMNELFAEYPFPFFIEGEETPKYLPRFGRDAREQYQAFAEDLKGMRNDEMNEDERLKQLSLIIQRLVTKYVEGRAESKTGKKIKEFPKATIDGKERRTYPIEFREAQQKVCSDAFLAIRSRHDQDFVEFFAGSICSVAQYLTSEEYQFLIKTLMTKPDPKLIRHDVLSWEDVKAIAMIAISACSFNVRPRDAQTQGSPS